MLFQLRKQTFRKFKSLLSLQVARPKFQSKPSVLSIIPDQVSCSLLPRNEHFVLTADGNGLIRLEMYVYILSLYQNRNRVQRKKGRA